MATVFIGIGSNLGNREENCREALRRMGQAGCRILAVSMFLETEPWGLSDQPLFINAAAEMETDLAPPDLLALLKSIEHDMGRTQSERWGPRIIDLDILFYDGLVLHDTGLDIPHPFLHERGFVLKPLAEIAPDFIHPELGRTIRELKEEHERKRGHND